MPALRSWLVWSLTTCLLLVAAAVYPQTVPHAAHHAHHNAAAHASVLCAWLCAAGQGLDGGTIVLPSTASVSAHTTSPIADLVASVPLQIPTSRGPPVLA